MNKKLNNFFGNLADAGLDIFEGGVVLGLLIFIGYKLLTAA
jgi:hypothetical protein